METVIHFISPDIPIAVPFKEAAAHSCQGGDSYHVDLTSNASKSSSSALKSIITWTSGIIYSVSSFVGDGHPRYSDLHSCAFPFAGDVISIVWDFLVVWYSIPELPFTATTTEVKKNILLHDNIAFNITSLFAKLEYGHHLLLFVTHATISVGRFPFSETSNSLRSNLLNKLII